MGLYGDGKEMGWTPVFIVRRFSEALGLDSSLLSLYRLGFGQISDLLLCALLKL